jgi:SRSO17 transposase
MKRRSGMICGTYVMEHLGEEKGILLVDETGFVKKGKKSAGKERANCLSMSF